MYLFINSNENCLKFHENSIYMNKKLDLIRKKFQKKKKKLARGLRTFSITESFIYLHHALADNRDKRMF